MFCFENMCDHNGKDKYTVTDYRHKRDFRDSKKKSTGGFHFFPKVFCPENPKQIPKTSPFFGKVGSSKTYTPIFWG